MSQLFKQDKSLLAEIIVAQNLKQRLLGLIPYSDLPQTQVFWIPSCQSVHTFFMKFSLDVVFTNPQFRITKMFEKVGPRSVLFGGFKSHHVFEMASGQIQKHGLKKGELLHVES